MPDRAPALPISAEAQRCLIDEPVIQLDALHRIPLTSLPVPRIEPHRRTACNDPEFRVVERERIGDVPRAIPRNFRIRRPA